jgi:hypothetical protein
MAPQAPIEYDPDTAYPDDAALEAAGYAAGHDVWDQVDKAYGNYLGDDDLGNAQLWSLKQAILAAYPPSANSLRMARLLDQVSALATEMAATPHGRERGIAEIGDEFLAILAQQ